MLGRPPPLQATARIVVSMCAARPALATARVMPCLCVRHVKTFPPCYMPLHPFRFVTRFQLGNYARGPGVAAGDWDTNSLLLVPVLLSIFAPHFQSCSSLVGPSSKFSVSVVLLYIRAESSPYPRIVR